MTELGILTLLVGLGALLSIAAYARWLWNALPENPLDDGPVYAGPERRR